MQLHKSNSRNRGFSLIELMIAILIGLVLMGGLIQVFLSSKQAYRLQDDQSRLQENGRYALQFLAKDMRMAGYMGCNNLQTLVPNVIANNPPLLPLLDTSTAVQGYYSGVWPSSSSFPAQPVNLVPSTSVILIRHASQSGVYVDQVLPSSAANIHLSGNPYGWNAGDILFVTDCQSADIFRATNVSNGASGTTIAHANSQNTGNTLSKAYGTDAQVMSFNYYMYYIGYVTGSSCPCALFRQSMNGAVDQLVDNVNNMQIIYGIDTNGDNAADIYTPTPSATAWPSVVSARINLLLSSSNDNLLDKPQVYNFVGVSSSAADKRLYGSFYDTVTFRNRVP